jgi:hypothetical protein
MALICAAVRGDGGELAGFAVERLDMAAAACGDTFTAGEDWVTGADAACEAVAAWDALSSATAGVELAATRVLLMPGIRDIAFSAILL